MRKLGIATIVTGLFTVTTIFFVCSLAFADQGEALVEAARRNDLKQVQELLESGADVNAKGNRVFTALMAASNRGHFDMVGLLLDKGADVNAKTEDGRTAMMLALGHRNVVDLLLKNGANVNAKDLRGETALMVTSELGSSKIVKMLLESGADINAKDRAGETALTGAARSGRSIRGEIAQRMGCRSDLDCCGYSWRPRASSPSLKSGC